MLEMFSMRTLQLFDISTTVDPSYVISLIRKLLPANASSNHKFHSDVSSGPMQGLNTDDMENSALTPSIVPPSSKDTSESMEIIDDFHKNATHDRENEAAQPGHSVPVGEEAWEEYGCILWDLSASKTHAELMVRGILIVLADISLFYYYYFFMLILCGYIILNCDEVESIIKRQAHQMHKPETVTVILLLSQC